VCGLSHLRFVKIKFLLSLPVQFFLCFIVHGCGCNVFLFINGSHHDLFCKYQSTVSCNAFSNWYLGFHPRLSIFEQLIEYRLSCPGLSPTYSIMEYGFPKISSIFSTILLFVISSYAVMLYIWPAFPFEIKDSIACT